MTRTKQELETDNQRLSEQNTMLHAALSAVMAGENQMCGRFTLDGTRVIGYVIGLSRADGGILLIKQTTDGCDDYRVCYLEREHEELRRKLGTSDYVRELYNVTGNGLILRNRAWRLLDEMPASV